MLGSDTAKDRQDGLQNAQSGQSHLDRFQNWSVRWSSATSFGRNSFLYVLIWSFEVVGPRSAHKRVL